MVEPEAPTQPRTLEPNKQRLDPDQPLASSRKKRILTILTDRRTLEPHEIPCSFSDPLGVWAKMAVSVYADTARRDDIVGSTLQKSALEGAGGFFVLRCGNFRFYSVEFLRIDLSASSSIEEDPK